MCKNAYNLVARLELGPGPEYLALCTGPGSSALAAATFRQVT